MFESLNLFKPTDCPHGSACDRPYCPFRHGDFYNQDPTVPPDHQKSVLASTSLESTNDSRFSTSESSCSQQASNDQLPAALENLSNALHAVQELIKFNAGSTSSSIDPSSPQAAQLTFNLANQLNNLSTKILGSKSPSKHQQASSNTPSYTPTPIKELKRLKQEKEHQREDSEVNESKIEDSKKRKSELLDDKLKSAQEVIVIESDEDSSVKKIKTDIDTKTVSSSPKSLDMASFSKLTAKQQLLKRHELLKKEPLPTTSQLREQRLKNQQAALLDTIKKTTPSAVSIQSQPKLILDSNDTTNKVPLIMRNRHLMAIFESLKILYGPDRLDQACARAAQEEKSAYDRAKSKNIYVNLAAISVKKIRSEMSSQDPHKLVNTSNQAKPASSTAAFSHEAMLGGSRAAKSSYSINKLKPVEIKDLSGPQLYQIFQAYVLTEKQLEDNSFPRWMPSSSSTTNRLAFIPNFSATKSLGDKFSENANQNKAASTASPDKYKLDNRKTQHVKSESQQVEIEDSNVSIKRCKRCSSTFYINPKDMSYLSTNSECVFHWGKLRNVRFNKIVEQKYTCCGGGCASEGCEVGKHVYDGDYVGNGTNLAGYVETTSHKSGKAARTASNIFAIDCEMCYTTRGLELTRVSVVDKDMNDVYETLVKPDAPILDYNTRWSGLTEESLRDCRKSLRQVQCELLELFNSDTILMGHSLESDFKALKLIHRNVIDTSVVFPHKMGPPLKRALRNLMSEYLQVIIQEDAVGHDSKEDASACIRLMMWKIKEDLNTKKFNSLLSAWSLLPTLIQQSQSIDNTKQPIKQQQQPPSDTTKNQIIKPTNKSGSSSTSRSSTTPNSINKSTTQLLNSIKMFSR